MNYSLSPDSKPGFPLITRSELKSDSGIPITWEYSAVFSDAPKDDSHRYVLVRVPTEFGTGWRIVGECWECLIFSPEAVLQGLADGSINVPSEAWA